jgi:UDP-N-acetylglucosamine 2-epimerase (non-hydrolysing)
MKLEPREFILTTLHRPSNVDDKDSLIGIIQMLNKYAVIRKIVFPIHPRTRKHMLQWRLLEKLSPNIILCEPIGYIDFLCLVRNAALLLTDSGGIQEETTFLGIPCVTLRENTERPVTIEMGTNYLVGTDLQQLDKVIDLILQNKSKTGRIPPLWDGRAAERICQQIAILLGLNLQPKPSVV